MKELKREELMQNEYIGRMVKNLPLLRASVELTQEHLSEKLGISRQTIVAIENEKSPLTWSLYLAMVCVFEQYEPSKKLLASFEVFSSKFLKDKGEKRF